MFDSNFISGLPKKPGEEWAFDGAQWKTIPDPMADWNESEERWHEGLSDAGYFEWFTTGERNANFWFTAFAPNPARSSPLQTQFPYLVNIEVICSMETVYCASFPAFLALIEKLNAFYSVWRIGKDSYGRPQFTPPE